MIKMFRCRETEALFNREQAPRFANIERVARRKLEQLHMIGNLEDLRIPPNNRLEALKGNRKGQWSIALTASGACVSVLKTAAPLMSKS
jgi:proteic killer suppression protein